MLTTWKTSNMKMSIRISNRHGFMTKPVFKYFDLGNAVTAFSTTRKGGESSGSYGEFNINCFCGDDLSCIAANRRSLAQVLGVDEDHIIQSHQTHDTVCRMITSNYFQLPVSARKILLEGVDCVMTNELGVCVGVSTADCIPVLLYDEKHHAAAAVHAGWRGTVARIAEKAVVEMQYGYQTVPEDIKAVIGPGISLHAFEVGQEVYDEFAHAGFDMSRIAKMYNKWHIDLPECNRIQLECAGVTPAQIYMSGICTYSQPEEFFSARRLGKESGRIFTGILLK